MTRCIPEINAVGLTTRKAPGEAAEAAFLAKVTSLGFGVAKTWGDRETLRLHPRFRPKAVACAGGVLPAF